MTATQLHKGTAVETWQIDPAHSSAQFAVRHLMIATVKGTFGDISGTVSFDPDADAVAVDLQIPVSTVDTRTAQRDAHLRSPDFFDAEKYPYITFKGKRVVGDINSTFRLSGDLTIRGITREIVLDVSNEGRGRDAWGNERLGFTATGKLNRQDYGLKWNMALEAGGVTVGDEVKIAIDVQIMRAAA